MTATEQLLQKIARVKLAARVINADVGLDSIINHMKAARAKKQAAITNVINKVANWDSKNLLAPPGSATGAKVTTPKRRSLGANRNFQMMPPAERAALR